MSKMQLQEDIYESTLHEDDEDETLVTNDKEEESE